MVESQPSKLLVAGSIPVSRSSSELENRNWKLKAGDSQVGMTSFVFRVPSGADVAQLVEHVLGKDGVSGSIPLIGSTFRRAGKGKSGDETKGKLATVIAKSDPKAVTK